MEDRNYIDEKYKRIINNKHSKFYNQFLKCYEMIFDDCFLIEEVEDHIWDSEKKFAKYIKENYRQDYQEIIKFCNILIDLNDLSKVCRGKKFKKNLPSYSDINLIEIINFFIQFIGILEVAEK